MLRYSFEYFLYGTGDNMIMYNPLQGCDSRCSGSSISCRSDHESDMVKMIIHLMAAS